MAQAIAKHDFSDGGLEAALTFFRRTRDELRAAEEVRLPSAISIARRLIEDWLD